MSTEITKENKSKVQDLIKSDALRGGIQAALPKHIKADRMMATVEQAFRLNQKLFGCTPQSLKNCILKSAQFGVFPDGRMAHLIPFKNECTFILDYKGIVDIVRRSGEVSDISADLVYEQDEFEFSRGDGGKLLHRPNLKAKDRGPVYAAYSYVRLKDGSSSYDVMTRDECMKVRDNSQGWKAFQNGYAKTSVWLTNEGEMMKKTVFKRHSKWLPFSPELHDAIEDDEPVIPVDSEETRFKKAKPVFEAEAVDVDADHSSQEEKQNEQPEPTATSAPTVAQPVDTGSVPDIHQEAEKYFITEGGLTFDQFRKAASELELIPNAGEAGMFDDLDGRSLLKLMRNKETTLGAIKKWIQEHP